ncbi:MAG: TonB family protein [Acidobacteriaceae bacterium]
MKIFEPEQRAVANQPEKPGHDSDSPGRDGAASEGSGAIAGRNGHAGPGSSLNGAPLNGTSAKIFEPVIAPRLGRRGGPLPTDVGELHLLVGELVDERSSGKMREAMWISIIVHLLIFLLILLSPKIFPHGWGTRVALVAPEEKSPQFLELPPDIQKYLKKPKTNIQSDKNRIAESKSPVLKQPTLEELERMRKRGAPGGRRAKVQPAPQPSPQQPQQQVAQQQPRQQPQQQPPPEQAQLRQPEQPQARANPFGASQSAGSAIQQAMRDAAQGRGSGQAGDYGEGLRPHAGMQGNAEILSDTQGVDFGPYLSRVVSTVRRNWYSLIPQEAMPPISRTGRVIIEFSILKNGSVGGLTIRDGSGTTSLDFAARGGITASNPFPPLPGEFKGNELKLRFYFFYLGPQKQQ